ncbi:hypothetical protein ABZ651_34915, partial [Streptomyces sp. NPDC007070]
MSENAEDRDAHEGRGDDERERDGEDARERRGHDPHERRGPRDRQDAHERHGHDARESRDTSERREPYTPHEPTRPPQRPNTPPHAGNGTVKHSPDGQGPDGLDSDELDLRRMLHRAVEDVEPRDGALDHLRRAVPARRARKRQAVPTTVIMCSHPVRAAPCGPPGRP